MLLDFALLTHCARIISNDTKKEKKKEEFRKDGKQFDISGLIPGTLSLLSLVCNVISIMAGFREDF